MYTVHDRTVFGLEWGRRSATVIDTIYSEFYLKEV